MSEASVPKVLLVVCDSWGVGDAPDAEGYGDAGADTLGNTARAVGGLHVPNLEFLGLGHLTAIEGVVPQADPGSGHGRATERSAGKDTTTGHWEMMGIRLLEPFPLYPDGFPPEILIPFVKRQDIYFNHKPLTIWFPPEDLARRAELYPGMAFKKGSDIIKLKVIAGDHLLVDRFTYNFRHPERGEIFVFKTKGIQNLQQDVLYIKRLVALPNEEVRLGNDRHLIINGIRLDSATPHFENVYSFDYNTNSPYKGHVNDVALQKMGLRDRYPTGSLAPLLPDETISHKVGATHYMAMGDNTLNSYDSRAWGDVPRENVIGRCWFVYWPFTERFGWGYH